MSAADVDAYLRDLEEPKRRTLEALRRTILEIVPDAEQVISYSVPAFCVEDQIVAGFGIISAISPSVARCCPRSPASSRATR
jgi:uncharacterized protein YdhG (YjbR/CyaY superfamily)